MKDEGEEEDRGEGEKQRSVEKAKVSRSPLEKLL